MHELSIAQSIIEIVEQHVAPEERGAVREIKVQVGELAGVIPDSLEFCFSAIIVNTPLQHARLVIEWIPLAMRCKSCNEVFESSRELAQCSACGGCETVLVRGNELHVVEIEMAELMETS